MIGARIKCDHCGFVGEMEMSPVCKTVFTAPKGWATVSATVRIKGERELTRPQRAELKKKVAEKTPPFHVCPGCIQGTWEVRVDRLLGHSAAS